MKRSDESGYTLCMHYAKSGYKKCSHSAKSECKKCSHFLGRVKSATKNIKMATLHACIMLKMATHCEAIRLFLAALCVAIGKKGVLGEFPLTRLPFPTRSDKRRIWQCKVVVTRTVLKSLSDLRLFL